MRLRSSVSNTVSTFYTVVISALLHRGGKGLTLNLLSGYWKRRSQCLRSVVDKSYDRSPAAQGSCQHIPLPYWANIVIVAHSQGVARAIDCFPPSFPSKKSRVTRKKNVDQDAQLASFHKADWSGQSATICI